MVKVVVYLKNSNNTVTFYMKTNVETCKANMIVKMRSGREFFVDTDVGVVILNPDAIAGMKIEGN